MADILAFHRRDPLALGERVTDTTLQKGMVWGDAPACLTIRFAAGGVSAELLVDGHVAVASEPEFRAMVGRMLGLTQDIDEFERRHRTHPELGRLIARHPGLRVPVAASPFEALTWAVTGQQISVGAAVSLRRRLMTATGVRHASGLLCYPQAKQAALLSEEDLRQAGFSMAKARTVLAVSQLVAQGALPLTDWLTALQVDEMRARLLAIRGIGPWTIDYTLLRGYGWLDGSLHGDAAVRRSLRAVADGQGKLGEAQAKTWLAQFSPWRALVAAHLWASQDAVAY